ncbi:Porin [Roseibacterium elongatum DSM 19469]|uniref:Porin n=2 Tax=Roseicyclus elongatus TaxID=159346 RepID=W8S3B7_9RHOB|nr:Porin [Roseibacterium elongatum DSM 19469]
MGIVGGDRYGDETEFWTSVDVFFTMSGETDGGLQFGAKVDLDEADNINGDGSDGVEVFLTGDFGGIYMGDTDGAYDRVLTENYGNPGSIDDSETLHAGYNNGAGLDGDYGGEIMRYEYSISGFRVAGSLELENGDDDYIWALGASYTFDFSGGSADVALAYQEDTGTNAELIGFTAGVTLDGGFTGGIMYQEGDSNNGGVDETFMGISAGYTFDAISIGVNYGIYEEDGSGDENDGFGIAATYDLGGGAEIRAAYANGDVGGAGAGTGNDGDAWSLGVRMSF